MCKMLGVPNPFSSEFSGPQREQTRMFAIAKDKKRRNLTSESMSETNSKLFEETLLKIARERAESAGFASSARLSRSWRQTFKKYAA